MELLERIGVLAEIARLKSGRTGRLGKTALMKLMHILQESYGLPLGYRFSLYNYGPYDSALMSDVDYAESLGQIAVSYSGDEGYQIRPAPGLTERTCPREAREKIGQLLQHFGDMNARELELRSTLLFLADGGSREALAGRLREIKPKYSVTEVEAALQQLECLKLLPALDA